MIRHIVAWNHMQEFSEKQRQEHAQKIKGMLEKLPEKIGGIISLKVYTKALENGTRDMVLDSRFESEQTLADYQINPAHKEASAFVRSVMTERVCLDYAEE